jgi:hypothetical protein
MCRFPPLWALSCCWRLAANVVALQWFLQGLIFQLNDVRFTHPEKWKRPPSDAPVEKADKAGALLRALHRAFAMTTMESGCRVPITDIAGNRLFTLVRSAACAAQAA